MLTAIHKRIKLFFTLAELGCGILPRVDYQRLNDYILRINQHKEVWAILYELSTCLKEMLDYELFGFALEHTDKTEVWIDPRTENTDFQHYIATDFNCQKNDYSLHHFKQDYHEESHNFDTFDPQNLISYHVIEANFCARLYILPKEKVTRRQDSIISTIVRSVSIALEKNLSILRLENAAAIDPLTNCYNRRALSDFLQRDIATARRHANDLSIIMIDIDNFKKINDRYGHFVGDAVLREFSSMITSLVRQSDYLARYGGEEFVLVLPNSSLSSAMQLAEKLRKWIMGCKMPHGGNTLAVTASFGVASLEKGKSPEDLLRVADLRLYEAKAKGKNCVVPSLLSYAGEKPFARKRNSGRYAHAG